MVKEIEGAPPADVVFRIITGSYEHNLLCLQLSLKNLKTKLTEIFHPIFHFSAHTQSIRCLSNNKRYLVSGSNDEHIRIYDLKKRKELGTLLHHSGSVSTLKFYGDKWLASGGADGKIFLYRTKDWEVMGELKAHKLGEINDISIHPSGKLGISVGQDKNLVLWNMMTGKRATVLKLRKPAYRVSWSPDGSTFVVGYDRLIELYSSESCQVIHSVQLTSQLQDMDLVTIKGSIYLGTCHTNGDLQFLEYNTLAKGQTGEKFNLDGHAGRVKSFSVYHHAENDVDYIASVSSDGKIVVHDLQTRDQIAVYDTGDRLTSCLIVPESIEQYDTVKNQPADLPEKRDVSEVEEATGKDEARRPSKRTKTTTSKAKIAIELEES